MTTFHSYDPSTRSQQAQPKACEACYARKVRCDADGSNEACRNCLIHGVECRSRTRKRKAADQTPATRPTPRPPAPEPTPHQRNGSGSGPQLSPVVPLPTDQSQMLDPKDVSAPLLFIGQQNPLASSPGTTANAQQSSHDEFHNAGYISRSAILGDDFPNIDHSNAEQPVRQHKLSATELQVLHLYHAFDLPELPLRQSLLEAFMDKCLTWMPVVNVKSLGATSTDGDGSLLLLQAVLLVGSLMRPDTCYKATLDSHYQRVKALINSGYERNPLNILASLCLIQWYTPSAPRDISTDTARFWESCALGIAQQIGLHRQPERNKPDYGLRRRIWWTLFIRDSLMATAHGRPRMLNLADCTMEPPSIYDFDNSADVRAQIFVAYQDITCLLYDLCNFLLKPQPPPEERTQISQRLVALCRNLPDALRLQDSDGWQRPYNFEIAQLHAPLLTTIAIFYRPRSVFAISPENAASIAASNLNFRILQAIHLREETRYLASPFSFYGMVAAIPHLSCLRVAGLRAEADVALDAIESFMEKLGSVRPAAANNLRNVRAIRKAINSTEQSGSKTTRLTESVHDQTSLAAAAEMLGVLYGAQATQNLHNITTILSASIEIPSRQTGQEAAQQQVYPTPDLNGMNLNGHLTEPNAFSEQSHMGLPTIADFGEGFSPVLTNHFQENTWMRNWIDDLHLFPE
ncbi:uncharacterized protein HMPREF1541_05196 [Cyphellophora europaea CBS 101466]|uniref:Zn(2)-C6 fungal-type domain-containing protein n=1 Tax=Cyphellophora europaea (strain CBS 101466) TaxID=1220924 RepID=W2RWR1_CYPE1|nr:uncharacterized protein HMPREF1541_05196 [Cyphellophora europaea CBS 101466]ETN40916.1 hypothetical protein HMPREF1541_05196 [Cyphellophora europaea CBS 101466]